MIGRERFPVPSSEKLLRSPGHCHQSSNNSSPDDLELSNHPAIVKVSRKARAVLAFPLVAGEYAKANISSRGPLNEWIYCQRT